MVKYARVRARDAETTKRELQDMGALDHGYAVRKEKGYVWFPVKEAVSGYEIIERSARKVHVKPRSLKGALKGVLSPDEFSQLVTSFDIYGTVAVIEVPHNLEYKAKEIGEAILEVHKNLRTVCMKAGRHDTEFRVMPVKVIAGENNLEPEYLEHGIKIKLHLGEVYFSQRLGTERGRIADLVKDGETIAGFFAGVGPFPLVIAKKHKCTIYAVELNPRAVELMKENIKLNKLKGEVIPILGDVNKAYKDLPKCDRVLMPAPKTGDSFLEPCILTAKPGGIVHYYEFAPSGDHYTAAVKKIRDAAKALGKKVRILNKKMVRQHAVRVDQIAIDFKVL